MQKTRKIDGSIDELQCSILTIWALKYGVEHIKGSDICLKARKFAKELKGKRDNKKCVPLKIENIVPKNIGMS